MTMTNSSETAVCPACGKSHPASDVFCPHCGKAVGGLRYVREEFAASRRKYEVIADAVTHFVSAPSYFGVHLLWLGAWVVLNSGIIAMVRRFDDPPTYNLLALLLSVESVFLTGFLLVSQNREAQYEKKRAELDYETAVQTSRLLQTMSEQIGNIDIRLERIECDSRIER